MGFDGIRLSRRPRLHSLRAILAPGSSVFFGVWTEPASKRCAPEGLTLCVFAEAFTRDARFQNAAEREPPRPAAQLAEHASVAIPGLLPRRLRLRSHLQSIAVGAFCRQD